MSTFVKHDKCPKCGSRDNLGVYSDHEKCFSFGCDYYKWTGNTNRKDKMSDFKEKEPKELFFGLPTSSGTRLPERGLTPKSLDKYKVTIPANPDSDIEAVFPRFNENGEHIANQIRFKGKKFKCEGMLSSSLPFGCNVFPKGGRSITITEGYYDALAAYEMTGSKYPNVGVMSASTAKREVADNFEYFNSFGEIIVNFDTDEPGQKAAKEVANLFEPGKVRVLKLRQEGMKDANDYAKAGLAREYVSEWFDAPTYMPDGLKLGSDIWGTIRDHKTPKSIPYPFEGLNQKTYGARLSEMVLLLADTGVGKTSVCKAIEYNFLRNPDLIEEGAGVGFMHFEEPQYDTAIGLMGIHAKKPYHLPDCDKTEEELRKAYDEVINTKRVVIWDHFGSNDIDAVLAKLRHMAVLGCKYIVIDHLSIIVSDQSGDERKQLDEISTKLKTLTMNLNIHVMCVIHVNRQGQVRGSAGPEQVANIIMRLERDKKDPDPWRRNVTKLSVEKNRFCGRTGPASYLFYDEATGCLEELSQELVQKFESGSSVAGSEFEAYG